MFEINYNAIFCAELLSKQGIQQKKLIFVITHLELVRFDPPVLHWNKSKEISIRTAKKIKFVKQYHF